MDIHGHVEKLNHCISIKQANIIVNDRKRKSRVVIAAIICRCNVNGICSRGVFDTANVHFATLLYFCSDKYNNGAGKVQKWALD